MAISDFEAQRLANIAERNALLKQLNLQSKAQAVVANRPARRSHAQQAGKDDDDDTGSKKNARGGRRQQQQQQQPAAKRIKRERAEFSGPRRTSSRLAGIQAGSEKAEEVDRAAREAAAAKEEQERIQRLRRQEDIDFQGSLVLGTDDKGKAALRARMNKLALWDAFEPATLKVVPERIYAMHVHPTQAKPIVFAGDKPEPSITTIKPHTRTVSAMHMHPNKPETLYTASYDSSIRATDLHKSVAVEVYGPADVSDDEPLSGIDMADSDPNVVYFTTLSGALGIHDTRASTKTKTKSFQLSEKKIGGFSLHPLAPHYLATASLDRTMKLWDLRKISNDGSGSGSKLPMLVGEHESRLSVSHAAFNAAGQVATIWPIGHTLDETAMKPEVVIRHNNQTGRWVTILRPQWQRRPTDGIQKFAIGNMNRFVDVYAADGSQLAQLGDDEGRITAVPAVAVWHESKDWIAGGNASGKVCLWM
ncbi:hypothetical protein DV738_g5113, partial [Chaetothyriales sp. CBS 135597]